MRPPAPVFASSLSREPDTARAIAAVTHALRTQLADAKPDLLVVFVSHHHGEGIEQLGPTLGRALQARTLIGCTGESIVGSTQEIENGPALSAFAAVLPWTQLRAFQVSAAQEADGGFAFSGLPPIEDRDRASVLLLADPYTFPATDYLAILNEQLPGLPVTGGMASGGMGPGQNMLFSDGSVEWHTSPLVGDGTGAMDNIWLPRDSRGVERIDLQAWPTQPRDTFVTQ